MRVGSREGFVVRRGLEGLKIAVLRDKGLGQMHTAKKLEHSQKKRARAGRGLASHVGTLVGRGSHLPRPARPIDDVGVLNSFVHFLDTGTES